MPSTDPFIDRYYRDAVKHHQAGRLQDAERLYRIVLQNRPNHPDANHNLGTLAVQVNQPAAGLPYLKAALEFNPKQRQYWISYIDALIRSDKTDEARQVLQQGRQMGLKGGPADKLRKLLDSPSEHDIAALFQTFDQGKFQMAEHLATRMTRNFPDFALGWKALGAVLQFLGRSDEALQSMQKAVQLEPSDAQAHSNLGNILRNIGKLHEAEASCRKAIAIQPGHAEAHCNLGNALRDLGQFAEAEKSYRKSILIKPDLAEVHSNLGSVLKELGRLEEAEASYRQAITLKPDLAEAFLDLGNILRKQGRPDEAEASFRQAIVIQPDYVDAYIHLGNILRNFGRFAEAESCCMQATVIQPGHAEAHIILGVTYKDLGRLTEAEACFRKAISINPGLAEAHNDLGPILKDTGRLAEAEACYKQALALKPDYFECFSNLLMSFNYRHTENREKAFVEAVEYGKTVRKKVSPPFTSWSCPKSSKIRVGFVSGDLKNHPVGFFLESILSEINPEKVELFAYPTTSATDSLTTRIKPFFRAWHPLCELNDEAAAKLIHGHGPDILIDLSGHTAYNRLPMFAWKPAPVQVSWLGYFATTGLAEIDYLLGDPHVSPPELQSQFTEKIWRLPDSRMCFTPPHDAPEIAPLPALAKGHVTFGSFQNLAKAGEQTFELWRSVLEALPDTRLRWQCKQFGDRSIVEHTLSRLNGCGISSGRVELLGPVNRSDYLALHAEVDFILDTFPFTGGTTTCEALWMGVPTLTLAGNTLISRQGLGLMTAAGLPEWVAYSAQDYVSKAAGFAGSASALESLARLRLKLRDRIASTPLYDSETFARNFEKAMRDMREAHWGNPPSKKRNSDIGIS